MTNPTDRRPSDDEIRNRLTPLHYHVTQEACTERAFTGEYWDTRDAGVYRCAVCDTELFDSDAKFASGTGWPSFDREITDGRVIRMEDAVGTDRPHHRDHHPKTVPGGVPKATAPPPTHLAANEGLPCMSGAPSSPRR
jgi:hypothetical protein